MHHRRSFRKQKVSVHLDRWVCLKGYHTSLTEPRIPPQSTGMVAQPDRLVYSAGPIVIVEDRSMRATTDRARWMVLQRSRFSNRSTDVESPQDSLPAVRVGEQPMGACTGRYDGYVQWSFIIDGHPCMYDLGYVGLAKLNFLIDAGEQTTCYQKTHLAVCLLQLRKN